MDKAQIASMVDGLWQPIFDMVGSFINTILTIVLFTVVGILVLFLLCCRINPFRLSPEYLVGLKVKFLPYNLFRWYLYDLLTAKERAGRFEPYGFTIFCGSQGSGKTVSMVEYLRMNKEKYPDCLIVTNFVCAYADRRMVDWRDLLEITNGEKGVIFAIDEIHSEYSAEAWKDFPEEILSQISMQRKQRIKIVATSQVYSRVAKPIREQCFSVVLCNTYFGRLTYDREFDSTKFTTNGDSSYSIKKGVKPIWRSLFVQSNDFRESFDTYEKIERMKKIKFIPRNERGAG